MARTRVCPISSNNRENKFWTRKKLIGLTLIIISLLISFGFIYYRNPKLLVRDWRSDPQISLLNETNSALVGKIFLLSENVITTSHIAKFCNNNNITSLSDPQIHFLIRLSTQNNGIPDIICDSVVRALTHVNVYEDFQNFNNQESDLFVRAVLRNFNGTMIERYHKAIRHAAMLGAVAFYEFHKSGSVPSNAIGIMTNGKLDEVEEASFVRLLNNFFSWDAEGELVVSFSNPGLFYDNEDLYFTSIFDKDLWFELNCTRGFAPVLVEVEPDQWEWRDQYREYHPFPSHDEWEKSRNTNLTFATLWNNTINDLEYRHSLMKRFVTDLDFLELYLQEVKSNARIIGIYPQVPEKIQEYVDFILLNGEKPDIIYLALNAWFEENIASKGLASGRCHGLSLSRIQVCKSVGIPGFKFETAMNSTHIPEKWRGYPHAEPGFMATSNLSDRLYSEYSDLLAYNYSVFCPLFPTKTYVEDVRVLAPYLFVWINGEERYLYENLIRSHILGDLLCLRNMTRRSDGLWKIVSSVF